MPSNEPLGYKTGVKSAIVTSLQAMFPRFYIMREQGTSLNVNIEYPVQEAEYPCIFVEFDEDTLASAGIGHIEYEDSEDDFFTITRRWQFGGTLKFSFIALKAKERDLLSDAFVKVVGFSDELKEAIAENEYIGMEITTDSISAGGETASPGTPWGGDEVVYTSTYSLDVYGEFFTDSSTAGILRRVDVYPRLEGEPDLPDNTHGDWV